MKVGIALVMETRLDRGAFHQSASAVTGINHATEVDRKPGFSTLHDDVRVLDHFADSDAKLSHAVCHLGIIFVGYEHDIAEIIAYTRGMPHLDTNRVERGVRCTLCVGNLDQWQKAIVVGCGAHKLSTARSTFNQLYKLFDQKGFNMCEDYRMKPDGDTFLLEKK